MNQIYKTKAELHAECEDAVRSFLNAGGVIEVVKARKVSPTKMSSKNSRGYVRGSSGFATGYPRKVGI